MIEGFRSLVNEKALQITDKTPTNTGGVSDEAMESRQHCDKQCKFQITSKVLCYLNCIGIVFFKCTFSLHAVQK